MGDTDDSIVLMPVDSLGEDFGSPHCTRPGCTGKFVAAAPVEHRQFGEVMYSKMICDACRLVGWRHSDKPNSFSVTRIDVDRFRGN
jgi:hypothetical protein